MYDRGKIIAGLVVFAGLTTLPFWYNIGKARVRPDPRLDTPAIRQMKEKHCIESKRFMIEYHMQMLNGWRNAVVRDYKTTYVSTSGQYFTMSLEDTCFHCHSNEKQFCNQCHSYADVKPYCWECHVKPGEEIAHGQR
ncbi:MAG: sulfate reduction electron transfer complex DsrMKJOP subunit DsrJ [Deltaproteobacteria bacterium]|nr:sulfate reduction electron transfer complex DsrMKJOP subunit DsrJ [Deltaproteobacteria bacterium]MCL5276992.1 sulfate reduction electron transfer complex DsrMKJOP subunit DsrJ [Deltaproteobacteria bacterium]